MKNIILFFVLAFYAVGSGLSYGEEPTSEMFIERILEALDRIHTVSYNLEERFYQTGDDSLYLSKKIFRYIECENKEDSTGLSKFVCFNEDGRFCDSYDGMFSLEYCDNHLRKTDMSRQSVVNIQSPFYNCITRLCEYLQEPDSLKVVNVEDKDDYWELRADIKGDNVLFYGYPRSYPTAGGWSRFIIRVDKDNFNPMFLSSSNSLSSKIEQEVSDVKINESSVESFSVEKYLPELPVLRHNGSEIMEYSKRRNKESAEAGMNCVLPTDTLNIIGGGVYSLNDSKGKVRVLMLTLVSCGPCFLSYPIYNEIYRKYSDSAEVDVKGVLYQYTGEMEAYKKFLKKYSIEFPVALNNGRFYKVFSSAGVAPIFIVIDRDDKIVLYHLGYDKNLYDIIDGKIRECLK